MEKEDENKKRKIREEKKRLLKREGGKQQEENLGKSRPQRKRWTKEVLPKNGCLECGLLSDDDDEDENENWIECENCLGWVHQSCAGQLDLTLQQLQAITFLHKTCEEDVVINWTN